VATAQGLPPDDLAGFEARAEEAARGVVRRIIAAILRAVREAVSPQAVDPVVVTAPASNMWVAQAPAAVMPVVVDTWSTAAAATAADFAAAGLPTSALRPDRAAAYITEATNRLVGLGDDIWQDIATQLAAGVDMGETIPELAARIQAVAPVSEARATTIARTEVIAASNAGSFAQAQVLDDPSMTKTWVATNDPRTRPTHRAADGQTVPLLSAFIVGGFPLMVPGDPTGPPEEVINCRCTQTYDFDAGALVAAWDTDVLDLGWSVVMAYPDQETLTAAGEPHSGAMIALVPSAYDAARLEVGEPAEELHTTLVYLGEDAKLTPEQRQALLAAAENVAESFPSLHLDGFAIAIFNPGNPDRDTCVVLEVSGDEGPELMLMRDMVAKLAADALGVMMPAQHVPYIPHVTLAYTDDPTLAGQLTHLTGPVTFDRLRVAFGGDVFDFPLTLPDEPDMPWDVTVAAGKFVEAKHKRDAHGQFATMAARLGAALKAHDGNGDPFAGFTREQLRREATKQGITLGRGESQESISKKLQAKLGGKSEDTGTATPKPNAPEAPAAPTPGGPSEAQSVSDALEDIYVRAANGEITGQQARAEAAAHLDGLKLSAPQLRDLSKQMGITTQPRATKGAVRDAIVERRVGAPLQARALARDTSVVEARRKPVAALAAPEPQAAKAPAAPAAPRAKREPKPQVEFAGDTAKVAADLKAIRDRGTARDTSDARGDAAAYLDSLKLTAPQMRALARELDVHTPAGSRKQDVRDRIIQNQIGAHLAAAAIARAETGKAAADAIERGRVKGEADVPPAPDVPAPDVRSFDDRAAGAATGHAALKAAPFNPGTSADMVDTDDVGGSGIDGQNVWEALSDYGNNGYEIVNGALRSSAGNPDGFPEFLRGGGIGYNPDRARRLMTGIDAAMSVSPLSGDVVVRRGIVDPDRTFGPGWNDREDMTGLAWTDHGFTSTTTGTKVGKFTNNGTGVEMRILVPKGTRAVGLSQTSGETGTERELLLDRGLSFRIVNDSGPKSKRRVIDVEVVPAGAEATAPPSEPAVRTAPDVSTWHGDLTPGQQQVQTAAASRLVTTRRQGGMMGVTSLETREGGDIIRKNVADRSGSADLRAPDEQADAEQLAVLVADAVGLRAPAVLRTGQHELEMEFIEGRTGEQDNPFGSSDPPLAVMRSPDGQRMGVLDAAINNYDRNPGNWITARDGRLVPIDHSMAFFAGDAAMPKFSTFNLGITESEAAVMRAQIEALRPEFDRVGRGEWLDDTLTRFDALQFAPDPTPEVPAAPALGAVDEARVAGLQSRLDALETQVAPLRAEELAAIQKEFSRGYLSDREADAQIDRQREIKALKREAEPLVAELMALLRERDGSNLGSVDDPDRDYWEQAKQGFNGVPTTRAPGVTATQVVAAQKAMDRYRIDDRTTVLNNEKLRAGDPQSRAWQRRVQGAIDTSRVSNDMVFYRGAVLPPSVLVQVRPGAVITDKGFQSTATKRDEAASYVEIRDLNSAGGLPVLFEIRTRAGTPAGDAQYGEVVFGSGRSMRIISVTEVNGRTEVVAEWV